MSNPTIAAFTTIRAAAVKTTYHTDDGAFTVHTIPGIVMGPFVSCWRHPIWWWKMRHLRADIRLLESEVDPEFSARMQELQEKAFLNGTGERTGQ